jgi:hypothetical protein
MSELAGNDAAAKRLLREVAMLRDDVALMRDELGAVAGRRPEASIPTGKAEETVRQLWAEGEASGIAGELDDVLDDIVAAIPGRPAKP